MLTPKTLIPGCWSTKSRAAGPTTKSNGSVRENADPP